MTYEKSKQRIVELLDASLGSPWRALSLFTVSRTALPTIEFLVDLGTTHD